MKILAFVALVITCSTHALVLDWSGSYELELSALQNADFTGTQNVSHNLHLKPNIHAFDAVHVHSWFYLASSPSVSPSGNPVKFHPQEGIGFGYNSDEEINLVVRNLYLELSRDFIRFQIGWKPHQFGMGMYYNDSSEPLSPVYSLETGRGSVSLEFFTKSFYVQPLIYLNHRSLLNLLIQAGYQSDNYGAEGLYKKGLEAGLEQLESSPVGTEDYLGLYAYYKTEQMKIQLELGRLDEAVDVVFGGAARIEHSSPWDWLSFKLDAGFSTSENDTKFYFDPTFSADLSFAIEEYEQLKSPQPEYLKEYLSYSFHSAFYIAPALRFWPAQNLSLDTVFSIHVSTSEINVLLYGAELLCTYHWTDNITWNSGIATLFPQQDNWHIGIITQAAITF